MSVSELPEAYENRLTWGIGALDCFNMHFLTATQETKGQKGGQCVLSPLPCLWKCQPQSCPHIFWISSLKAGGDKMCRGKWNSPNFLSSSCGDCNPGHWWTRPVIPGDVLRQTNVSKLDWDLVDCVVQMALAESSLPGWAMWGNSSKLIWTQLACQ